MARRSGIAAKTKRTTLIVDGVDVQVVRRFGQKSARLKVKPPDGHLEVTGPFAMTDREISTFVQSHWDWIARQKLQTIAMEEAKGGTPTQAELDAWRECVKAFVPPLIDKWAPVMGVRPGKVTYRNMVSRWGSCNVKSGHITINIQLAAQPPDCLEYVVVHELCHLLEPSHNARFHALMTQFLPTWKQSERKLRGAIRR
ncbi:M48 family metallopeptidase [Slackia heliotrinireducens]|uniref:Predicted metal-dependent hydrolase n=1 Tax=Slackia heliotrinireducens (strain ATCC 29202 / DSM 20476 / NCTC 11029 / RHS 1) TaxID=471855 RepID=C7N4G4_SLAHD|nr:SprT family zinc-dependent metalloprotease [Slackia heliotrinireducens]ACV21799.1 predicted metal-dependent hydrolase [Slackia heliotrinireducens DSM 20476]VEG99495.1 Protein of uncharacterised function DUF45 [Slackia heliotrinireducens]